jgi:hypothetical protein
MTYIRIDVDLDDVYGEMDRNDKRTIAEWLYDDGILQSHTNPEIRNFVRGDNESQGERELRDNLTKIWNSYYQMNDDELSKVEEISKKY